MRESWEKAKVQEAFETALSGIQDDPWMAQRVLNAVKQEHKSGWRCSRRMVILMVVMGCLLASTAALAWSLSPQYFAEIAQMTVTSGDYADWSLEEKRYMAQIMGKYGILTDGEARKLSRASEKEIDACMLARYGAESAPDDLSWISINRIAWVEMGPYVYWSNDTWIRYTSMMLEIGLWEQNANMDMFYVPGDEAVSPEAAIEAARRHLLEQKMSPQRLDSAQCIWHYMTDGGDINREHLQYYITFLYPDKSENRVVLSPQGEVLHSK